MNSIYPTCSVIGHVDVGKTSFLDYFKHRKTQEVRGITQQLTVYEYDKTHLNECIINPVFEKNFLFKGIVLIDTPGHEYFSSMRTITSSISHMVLVVIDLVKGLEPTHIEIIKYLKANHIDFIIILNKMDRIYGWTPMPKEVLKNSYSKQKKETMTLLQDYLNKIICQLAENEINACAYYNNTDYKTFISMVPISAKTGEGIGDLLMLISKLLDRKFKLFDKAPFYKEIRSFVVDSKIDDKFGKIYSIINHHSLLNEHDEISILNSSNKIIKCKVKQIIKDERVKMIEGYSSANICFDDKHLELESGDIIITNDCQFKYKDLMLSKISLNFNEEDDNQDNYDTEDKSVETYVEEIKYDKHGLTIISLSKMMHGALYKMFKNEMNIPVAICTVDKLNKNTIIKTYNNNKVTNTTQLKDKLTNIKHDYYRVIVIFEPTVEETQIDKDLLELATKNKIHIIKSNSIYRLKEMYQKYCDQIKNKIRDEHIGLIDCELEILPNCVFLKTSPLLFGVKVKSGKLNIGTKLLATSTKDDKQVVLGIVKSMEKERKPITVGEVKDEICIRVEMIDRKIVYKTDFDESYKVTTYKSDQDKIICEVFKNELK